MNKEDLFDFTGKEPTAVLEKEIKATKLLRKELDEQLQLLRKLPASNIKEIAIVNLQQTIMWLGMNLKRIADTNPYKDSYNPENTKIAPTYGGLKL